MTAEMESIEDVLMILQFRNHNRWVANLKAFLAP
jgi:hypothetical protein